MNELELLNQEFEEKLKIRSNETVIETLDFLSKEYGYGIVLESLEIISKKDFSKFKNYGDVFKYLHGICKRKNQEFSNLDFIN